MLLAGVLVAAAVTVPPGEWVVNHAHPGHYTQPTVRYFHRGPVDRYREQAWHCYVDTLDRLWADYRLAGSSRIAWEEYKQALANARRAYVYQDPYLIGQDRYGAWNPAWNICGPSCPGCGECDAFKGNGCPSKSDQPSPALPDSSAADEGPDEGADEPPAATVHGENASKFRLTGWPYPVARAAIGTARAARAIVARVAHPLCRWCWRGWRWHGCGDCRGGDFSAHLVGGCGCADRCQTCTDAACVNRGARCADGCASPDGGEHGGPCCETGSSCGRRGCGWSGRGYHGVGFHGYGYFGHGYHGCGILSPWASPHAGPAYFGPIKYSYYHPSKLAWGEPLAAYHRANPGEAYQEPAAPSAPVPATGEQSRD